MPASNYPLAQLHRLTIAQVESKSLPHKSALRMAPISPQRPIPELPTGIHYATLEPHFKSDNAKLTL